MDISDLFKKAGQTKQDLFAVLAKEWRGFLEAFFADSTLEIHARIKLVPSDKKGVKITVVSKDVKVHKTRKKPPKEEEL
ncbi:MAG: hypothetical protein WCK42_01480 [Myxococcaceae bacterium]